MSDLSSSNPPPMAEHKHELLLHMYDQMFNDINRRIGTIWQPIGTLAGMAALLALVNSQRLPMDLAIALIVVACAWLAAHCYDSSYWYNRNSAVVANIERHFLGKGDLQKVYHYFGAHRQNMKMLTHIRIQQALGFFVLATALTAHFSIRVMPGFAPDWRNFDPVSLFPYVVGAISGVGVLWFRADTKKAYTSLLRNSPGIPIDASGIVLGPEYQTEKKK